MRERGLIPLEWRISPWFPGSLSSLAWGVIALFRCDFFPFPFRPSGLLCVYHPRVLFPLPQPPPLSTLIWTRKGKSCTIAVYLHMFEWPIDSILYICLSYTVCHCLQSPRIAEHRLAFFCHRRLAISLINKSPVDLGTHLGKPFQNAPSKVSTHPIILHPEMSRIGSSGHRVSSAAWRHRERSPGQLLDSDLLFDLDSILGDKKTCPSAMPTTIMN